METLGICLKISLSPLLLNGDWLCIEVRLTIIFSEDFDEMPL